MTLQITSDHVNTKQGVPISCIGVAQVKIESRNQQMLSTGTLFSWKASYYMNHITL